MYYLEHYTNLLILCIVMSGVERMSARKLNECSNTVEYLITHILIMHVSHNA